MATTGSSNSNGGSNNCTTSNSCTSGPLISRGNVSVTSINCSDDNGAQSQITQANGPVLTNGGTTHFYENGGIRISVPKMEESDESDTELTNIENNSNSNVGMRENRNKNIPRPMSWEGELSENEDSNMMVVENGEASNLSAATIQTTSANTAATTDEPVNLQQLPKEFKPEFLDNNSSSNLTATSSSATTYLNLNSKKFPEYVNLKNETGVHDVISSPLLARSKSNLLPANPSPDSAIHSVYTHSSPSQSPLTSRHTPYTPSLSRNNSDASHSSCYSYSSEFSPTHSPIQSRHYLYGPAPNAAQAGLTNSPAHHSLLYRPMLDSEQSTSSKFLQPKEEGVLEGEAIPSPGISRQQLINSPCPICGDKISGFHYGIFSCESCKGFF